MKERSELHIEELLAQSEELMNLRRYPEAKEVLLELLSEEPAYGPAHNHLGWLYTHYLTNFVKAEKHLLLAVKYAEGYPAAIQNYAIFLYEANKHDALFEFVNSNLNYVGVDRALLLALKGNVLEARGDFRTALKLYKQAKVMSMSEHFLQQVQDAIDRIKTKTSRIGWALASL